MLYEEEVMEDMRRYLQDAESSVYSALSVSQEEPGDAKLENMLDDIHDYLLRALEQL